MSTVNTYVNVAATDHLNFERRDIHDLKFNVGGNSVSICFVCDEDLENFIKVAIGELLKLSEKSYE